MLCSQRGQVCLFVCVTACCAGAVACSSSSSSGDDTAGDDDDPSSAQHDATGGEPDPGEGSGAKDDTGGKRGTDASGGSDSGSGGDDAPGTGGAGEATETSADLYGDIHEGQFHLGPVDFAESDWPNACTPEGGYPQELWESTGLGGEYLAGVAGSLAQDGGICDSCIQISTGSGQSIVARVVTYGDTNAPGDIDVSPSVYQAINPQDAFPRPMTWQLAKCPDSGTLRYEWQTGANVWWTSLWVRNQKVPLAKVEVQSSNHPAFIELRRASDGTLNDDSGFGEGSFTLRLTAVDGQVITDTFDSFEPGSIVVSEKQFE